MKKFRKIITVLLVVLCLTAGIGASAQTAPPPAPDYTLISVASSGLSISGGLATCSASVTGQVGVDSVSLTGYLQRYNGTTWVTIKSWTKSADGRYCSMGTTYYVSSGYNYRYRVYCTAYDGGSSETVIVTSYDSY